jgi:hypothetical protein
MEREQDHAITDRTTSDKGGEMDRSIKPEPLNGTQSPDSKDIESREKERLEKEIERYLSMYLGDCLSSLETLEAEGESGYFSD